MRGWALGLIVLVALLVGAAGVRAVSDVAPLFDLGAGARALGMGGAFLALADDEGAVATNPAGLGWLGRIGIYSAYVEGFAGESTGVVGVALPWFGVAGFQLDSGPIPSPQGEFRYVSQGGVVSVGVALGPLGVGARLKLYRVAEPSPVQGLAVDPAILWAGDVLRLALIWENAYSRPIAGDGGGAEDWPATFRAGAAIVVHPIADAAWDLAVEAGGLPSAHPDLRVGTEIWAAGLAARVGYDGSTVSVGLSATLGNLRLDWAYDVSPDLGASHRVSVTFRL